MSAAIDPLLAEAKQTLKDAKKAVSGARRTIATGRKKAPKIVEETTASLNKRADRARGQATDAFDAAGDQLDDMRELALDQLESARIYVARNMKDQPIAATLAAIGVGFFLGVLFSGGRR